MYGFCRYYWPAEKAEKRHSAQQSALQACVSWNDGTHWRPNNAVVGSKDSATGYVYEGAWMQGYQHGLGSLILDSDSSGRGIVRLLGRWDGGRHVVRCVAHRMLCRKFCSVTCPMGVPRRTIGLDDGGRLMGESIMLLANGDLIIGLWGEDIKKRDGGVHVGEQGRMA